MKRTLHSSKFWTAVVDMVLSTVLYFSAKYMAPSVAEDIHWLIASYQPVFALVIVGIFAEDAAEKVGTTGAVRQRLSRYVGSRPDATDQ